MNRATKILLAVVAVIVLSYPGIAWVTGIAVESQIQQGERQTLDRVPYLTLVKREYRRGVYESTEIATYDFFPALPPTVSKQTGGALAAAGTFTVTSHIQHGPFPGMRTVGLATIDSTVSAPPAVQKELSAALGSQPILRVRTTVGLFGGVSAALTSPAFTLKLPGGSSLSWGGLTGTFGGTRNGGRGTARFTAPRLAFQGARGGMELASLDYSGIYEKVFDDLYAGTAAFTVGRIDGSSAHGTWSLQHVSLTSTSSADGPFFDMRVDIAMAAAKLGAVQLRNVVYSESLEHFYGASLASMVQAMRRAELRARANPAQLQAGMREVLRQYGIDLLLHDPVIDIHRLSFTMPEGSFLFSAKLSAPGLSRADLQWPAVIAALKEHAEIAADLRVDNGLVQKLLAMASAKPKLAAGVSSFEQRGYLTAGASAVTTHLAYDAGKLTLNGNPFPPAPSAE